MSEPIRLNKYLADNHYCSRREADRLIQDGQVFINNRRAKLGDKVGDHDVVRVEGRNRGAKDQRVYILLNKPIGISTDRKATENVYDIIDTEQTVYSVGSMPVQDEGLLVLTNDEFFAKKMALPKFARDQEFVVEVDRPLDRGHIVQMQNGISLKDGMTKPAKVRQIDEVRFAIILSETKPNLIRRMCESLGYHVISLIRSRILTLKMLSTYPTGQWRPLTQSELSDLKKAVGINERKKGSKAKKTRPSR